MYYETAQISSSQWAVINALTLQTQSVWESKRTAAQVCKDLNRSSERK